MFPIFNHHLFYCQENCASLVLSGKKPVNLVDIPGSERIRDNILDNYAGHNFT